VLIPALLKSFSSASDRDDLLRRLSTERGFYVPSFYDVEYAGDGNDRSIRGRARTPALRPLSKRLRSRRRRRSTRRRQQSSRPTQSLARGFSSRSSAAAQTCAASAGRATTICGAGVPQGSDPGTGAASQAVLRPGGPGLESRCAITPRSRRSSSDSSRWVSASARHRCV
jgi:hypothetical protein